VSSPPPPTSSNTLTNNDKTNSLQDSTTTTTNNNNNPQCKVVEKDENPAVYPPPKSPPLFSFLEIAQILESAPRNDRDSLIGMWTRKRQIFISRQRCYSILDEYERTRQITEYHYPYPGDGSAIVESNTSPTTTTNNNNELQSTTTTTRRTMFTPPEVGALLHGTAKENRFEVLHLMMHKKQVPAGKSMLWNLLLKHKKGEYINPEWGSVGRRPLATTDEVKILLQQTVMATAAAASTTATTTTMAEAAFFSDSLATTCMTSTATQTQRVLATSCKGAPKTVGGGSGSGGIVSSQAMQDALVHHQLLTNGCVVLPGRSTIRNYVHLATLTAAEESVSSTTISPPTTTGARIRPGTTRAATVTTTSIVSQDYPTTDIAASGTTDARSDDDSSDMHGSEDDNNPLNYCYHPHPLRRSSFASTMTGV
jgi:hypothetical protein